MGRPPLFRADFTQYGGHSLVLGNRKGGTTEERRAHPETQTRRGAAQRAHRPPTWPGEAGAQNPVCGLPETLPTQAEEAQWGPASSVSRAGKRSTARRTPGEDGGNARVQTAGAHSPRGAQHPLQLLPGERRTRVCDERFTGSPASACSAALSEENTPLCSP